MSRLSFVLAVSLNDWPLVNLFCVQIVIQYAERHGGAEYQATIIHRRWRGMIRRWPKTEEEHYNEVTNCEAVGDDAQSARNPPRAPYELCTRNIGEHMFGARIELDVTLKTPPEQEYSNKEVGAK